MKKIISLVLACMLLFSVSAFAESYATIEMGEPELVNNTYYKIVINLTKLPTWVYESTDFTGYNGFQVEVDFDENKFDAGYVKSVHPALGPQYAYGNATIPVADSTTWEKTDDSKAAAKYDNGLIKFAASTGTSAVFCSAITYGGTPYYTNPTAAYAEIYLTPKDGAKGKSDVSFSFVKLAGPGGVQHSSADGTLTAIGTTIDLGGEEVDETPETSTVRTFPKLRWDETNKQLTTVGVITIGKDYDTVKYGINIEKGEGTVNYWANSAVKTTDEKEAYYAVRLDDIDDTKTDIKSTSAAKAILSNGAEGDAETKDSVIE